MRCVEVPVAVTLYELHRVIQIVMGWHDDHLHEFRVGRRSWERAGPLGAVDETETDDSTLADLLAHVRSFGKKKPQYKKITYVYDFGDNWEHAIKVEKLVPAEPGVAYPRLIEATGACPPEDIGGGWGYAEFLEVVTDPSHPDHAEMIENYGPFDPAFVDTAKIHQRLARPR